MSMPDLVLHVSPDGAADGDGSASRPFATPAQARDALRVLGRGPAAGATVCLAGGRYPMAESLTLDQRDSGEPEAPIRYTARPAETPRLNGGVPVPAAAFAPVADPLVRQRLATAARDHVVVADLAALGVRDCGRIEQHDFSLRSTVAPELFVNGVSQRLARYPSQGELETGRVVDPGGYPRACMDLPRDERPACSAREFARPPTFGYLDPRPERWASLDDVWMSGQWAYNWADGTLQIGALDREAQTITTTRASMYQVHPERPYHYFNVLDELDTPGEFYLDRVHRRLYLYPEGDLADAEIELSLLADPVVRLDGASHVRISDLVVEVGRGDGIVIRGGEDCGVERVTARRLGGHGIVVGQRLGEDDIDRPRAGGDGGRGHRIEGCTVFDTGSGGIFIGGGDRPTLTPAGNSAIDNEIFRYSRVKATNSPGLMLAGVGNRAAHNYLHDAPNGALWVMGNDHVVELNEIGHIMQTTGDGGAIYLGGDWTDAGNVIRHNYIHHVDNDVMRGPKIGIYIDDFGSGLTIEGNVVAHVERGVFLHGGRDNRVSGNILVDNRLFSVAVTASGVNQFPDDVRPGGITHNLLLMMPYESDPWRTRYPHLAGILDDHQELPKRNVIVDNLIWRSAAGAPFTDPDSHPWAVIEGNVLTDDDPGFADAAADDYRLSAPAAGPAGPGDSAGPAWAAIPFDRIGLRRPSADQSP
jgi:parallel beta-helix repeat protein